MTTSRPLCGFGHGKASGCGSAVRHTANSAIMPPKISLGGCCAQFSAGLRPWSAACGVMFPPSFGGVIADGLEHQPTREAVTLLTHPFIYRAFRNDQPEHIRQLVAAHLQPCFFLSIECRIEWRYYPAWASAYTPIEWSRILKFSYSWIKKQIYEEFKTLRMI